MGNNVALGRLGRAYEVAILGVRVLLYFSVHPGYNQ